MRTRRVKNLSEKLITFTVTDLTQRFRRAEDVEEEKVDGAK